jgi:hypothetical protein
MHLQRLPCLPPTFIFSNPFKSPKCEVTYQRLLQLLQRRADLGLHTRQHVPGLSKCLLL